MTVPFFVSFFLGHPTGGNAAGAVAVCATVFGMAAVWFMTAGMLCAALPVRGLGPAGHRWMRYTLAACLAICAGLTVARTIG